MKTPLINSQRVFSSVMSTQSLISSYNAYTNFENIRAQRKHLKAVSMSAKDQLVFTLTIQSLKWHFCGRC